MNKYKIIIKLLLKTGKVNINLRNKNNSILLLLVAENKYIAIIKLLLKINKIDINLKD